MKSDKLDDILQRTKTMKESQAYSSIQRAQTVKSSTGAFQSNFLGADIHKNKIREFNGAIAETEIQPGRGLLAVTNMSQVAEDIMESQSVTLADQLEDCEESFGFLQRQMSAQSSQFPEMQRQNSIISRHEAYMTQNSVMSRQYIEEIQMNKQSSIFSRQSTKTPINPEIIKMPTFKKNTSQKIVQPISKANKVEVILETEFSSELIEEVQSNNVTSATSAINQVTTANSAGDA